MDAPVLRDENKDADDDCTESGTDERLYYANDANMNVTALLESDRDVVERYMYDPYGEVTIYDDPGTAGVPWPDGWSDEISWTNSKQNHIRYCGYFFDNETGLYRVRNRVYHPTRPRPELTRTS